MTSNTVLHIPIRDKIPTPSEMKCLGLITDCGLSKAEPLARGGNDVAAYSNLIGFLRTASSTAVQHGYQKLGEALAEVVTLSTIKTDFGGYGLDENSGLTSEQESDVVFLCSAYLEALKHELRTRKALPPLDYRPNGRRGMTMTEKILANHDISRKGWVKPGDVVQVDVDWVLASELTYKSIEASYDSLGRPGIFRNDRFWLAGDHRVEPPLYDKPSVKILMQSSRRAQKDFKMTDFQGFNYTIMHTEFVRERAQPGMLCIGADSHTCSAGLVSCLSIGMGATDVAMPLITGQTWFTVPQTVSLRLIGAPPKGVGGKDTILYILQQFKRNTIAADRVVEFSGPGLKHLSCDARFAISNMCTEFGAVTGIFESDEQTFAFINRRHQKRHKQQSIYFKPDDDAVYAEQYTIDLSEVESFIAVYPSPDNVVPISEVAGTKLDGCFIGACTTAEEDLLIGAMVLELGLKQGLGPVNRGRRLVVPGSRPILHKLERLGYLDIYRQAGFKIGVPGCSMCVGQGVDQAEPGETWLSSQNRNFKNRMGPGSIANLGSAATVAASSFTMSMTDPRPFLDDLDLEKLRDILARRPIDNEMNTDEAKIIYQEPYGLDSLDPSKQPKQTEEMEINHHAEADKQDKTSAQSNENINGKALVLGDFIDTDAIIPSKFLATSTTEEELSSHCMEFFMPEFREKVRSGFNIIVAGQGFGVGSSRDVAVPALKGTGVRAVIAKSFAFIYARNQPNLGLLGITLRDEEFYSIAKTGAAVEIDLNSSVVVCGDRSFPFQLSDMEKRLFEAGGITAAFKAFGKGVFNELCKPIDKTAKPQVKDIEDT